MYGKPRGIMGLLKRQLPWTRTILSKTYVLKVGFHDFFKIRTFHDIELSTLYFRIPWNEDLLMLCLDMCVCSTFKVYAWCIYLYPLMTNSRFHVWRLIALCLSSGKKKLGILGNVIIKTKNSAEIDDDDVVMCLGNEAVLHFEEDEISTGLSNLLSYSSKWDEKYLIFEDQKSAEIDSSNSDSGEVLLIDPPWSRLSLAFWRNLYVYKMDAYLHHECVIQKFVYFAENCLP